MILTTNQRSDLQARIAKRTGLPPSRVQEAVCVFEVWLADIGADQIPGGNVSLGELVATLGEVERKPSRQDGAALLLERYSMVRR